jgi:hypothetical protein
MVFLVHVDCEAPQSPAKTLPFLKNINIEKASAPTRSKRQAYHYRLYIAQRTCHLFSNTTHIVFHHVWFQA